MPHLKQRDPERGKRKKSKPGSASIVQRAKRFVGGVVDAAESVVEGLREGRQRAAGESPGGSAVEAERRRRARFGAAGTEDLRRGN